MKNKEEKCSFWKILYEFSFLYEFQKHFSMNMSCETNNVEVGFGLIYKSMKKLANLAILQNNVCFSRVDMQTVLNNELCPWNEDGYLSCRYRCILSHLPHSTEWINVACHKTCKCLNASIKRAYFQKNVKRFLYFICYN